MGAFCQWRRDAALPGPNGECADVRIESQPWARRLSLISVDEVSAEVCTLATTTCPAFLQHRQAIAGCETAFTDDAACGVDGLNDGRCRNQNATPP